MSEGSAIIFVELIMWGGGIGFLLWLDRRNLKRAKERSLRRKALEAEAAGRAQPSPRLVPTAAEGATTAGSGGKGRRS